MPVLAGEAVRVDLIGDIGGTDEIVNTFQFLNTLQVDVTGDQAVDDMEEIMVQLFGTIELFLSVRTIFRVMKVQNITTGELLGTRNLVPQLAGAQNAQMLPAQICGIVSLPTRTPRVIMRKVIGTITVSSIEVDASWGTNFVAALGNYGALLLVNWFQVGTTWRYGYQSPKALTFVFPSGVLVSNVAGARRSRKPGVGS